MNLASCPFCDGAVHLVFDSDFRRGVRYGIVHERPCPLLPTLWAAYGVESDTLARCLEPTVWGGESAAGIG